MEVAIRNGQDDDDQDELMEGTILSVHVKNFFCHENFKVEFKKRVTFIVGRNGSGKSAILTALVVGLGGKALDTNRGKNFQSFVKKGANSASVEIKIRNHGFGAYRPEKYGDIITIVKIITASGTSSYKIGSRTGQLIPATAKEVAAIVSALNIQVNNPISVLNQDNAREFALRAEPSKLYSLFMRATNLHATEENYERSRAICKASLVSWERKNKCCIELKKEYDKWQKLYEQMQSRKDIQKRLKLLKIELPWSEVAECEQEVATIDEQCRKQRAKCERLEAALRDKEQSLSGANTQALKNELQELERKKVELEKQLRPLDRATQDARDAHREAGDALAKRSELLNREKRKVRNYEQEIETGSAASQRAELERRVASGGEAVAAARARLDTLRNDDEQANGHAQRLADERERALQERGRLRSRLEQRRQQLREVEAPGADPLAVYGGAMAELCRRVRAAAERGHFSAPPRGPVGQYIKVKDTQWTDVLEHLVGGLLRSFCVNTPEDSRKLFKIMEQVPQLASGGGKPTVTCSKFLRAQHDVRASSVHSPPHRSALQALHVEDPVVANFLIDNLALERVLLVPDHKEAMRLADDEARVPRNCGRIVTLDCREFYPAPNYRSYGGRRRPARLLHTDTEQRQRQLRAEIEQLESEVRQHEASAERLAAEQRRAQEGKEAAARALRALAAELVKREAERDAAVAALDALAAPQHALLDDELNASKQRVQQLTEELGELTEARENLKRQLDAREAEAGELRAQLAHAAAACRRLIEEITREETEQDRGAMERRSLEQKLQEERDKLQRGEEILRSKRGDVDELRRAAAAAGPRPDQPRARAAVTELMERHTRKMNALQQTSASREEVERARAEAERKYRGTAERLNECRVCIDRIERAAGDYLEYCYKLKKAIGRQIKIRFMTTLTTNRYNGEILIDHSKDTLELKVSGRETARHADRAASLSGGERSFTTVAFITSLWECIELPFYFMDEFDVFMDPVNQQIAVRVLLHMATRLRRCQFVLLTPHANNLAVDDAPLPVDIISLGDPRRQ